MTLQLCGALLYVPYKCNDYIAPVAVPLEAVALYSNTEAEFFFHWTSFDLHNWTLIRIHCDWKLLLQFNSNVVCHALFSLNIYSSNTAPTTKCFYLLFDYCGKQSNGCKCPCYLERIKNASTKTQYLFACWYFP